MLDFALIDPTSPHPPAATVSDAGVLCFNATAARVLDLRDGVTFVVGAYVNPDDPPPMILLLDSAFAGLRPIPEVSIEKRTEGFCVDFANILTQLGFDFTSHQLTLPVWVVKREGHPAIALLFPPEALSWP